MSWSVPHVSQFPAEDSAHGGEGSSGLLSSHRQGLRSLLIPVRGEKKIREGESERDGSRGKMVDREGER